MERVYGEKLSKEQKELEEIQIDYLRRKIEQEKINKARMLKEMNRNKVIFNSHGLPYRNPRDREAARTMMCMMGIARSK